MGIDFNRTFGAGNNNSSAASTSTTTDKPKAKFWLNIGYVAAGAGDDGEDRFVSLPVGIPLDTMEHVATNSRSDSYREFQSARNDLLDQIMSVAAELAPGQDQELNLTIQLRRVAEEQAPVEAGNNRFARELNLVG